MPRLSKIGAACLSAFGFGTGGANVVTADYLVVAGGGGGGGAGGGGGGGYQTSTTSLSLTQTYTVIVGAGGSGAGLGANTFGGNGTNSTFGALTASVGGGGGGSYSNTGANANGLSGGSGGGGGWANSGTVLGGSATSGQGYAGGTGDTTTAPYNSGGGGGAGAAGGNASGSVSGNGGAGASTSITGSSLYFSGGGGGGAQGAGSTAGNGGIGGGGGGANGYGGTTVGTGGGSSITSGLDGTTGGAGAGGYGGNGGANSGGGGGGMSISAILGGNGGSGVVIVRYLGAQQFGGGIVSSDGTYTIHTFKTSGQLVPMTPVTASYLIVAGGGGAGPNGGGGGGAGGLLTGSTLSIDTSSTYIVTVGAGGAGYSTPTAGLQGGSSSFFGLSTTGGGHGGVGNGGDAEWLKGKNGGSGGGSHRTNTAGTGIAGQGYAGAQGLGTGGSNAGGGGGAGAAGSTATSTDRGGNGGVGISSSITGTATYYAGGGGGGGATNGGGTGGAGGGGNGGGDSANGASATNNTGGGAGGSGANATGTANGGSGVVIISYAGTTQLMAGGTVTIVGGNVIHTFTSSGYLTPLTFVGRSLRFRSAATAYLNRVPTVTSNRQVWTWSGWVKRGNLGDLGKVFAAYNNSGNSIFALRFEANSTLNIYSFNTATSAFIWQVQTTQVFRDPAAWYHLTLAVDTTQATAANRLKLYVNGTQVSAFSTASYPSQNTNTELNGSGYSVQIASGTANNSTFEQNFDGYMAEVRFIDGQALTPNSFGTFNSYGVWQPINYGGSYGTNGFYLPFSDIGDSSYAGSFNGTTQYLSTSHNSVLNLGGGDWTIEAWINPNGDYTKYRPIVSKRTSGSGEYQIWLEVTSGEISFWNGTTVTYCGATPTANAWSHVAFVQSGSNITVYLNGAAIKTFANTITNQTLPFYIGHSGMATEFFAGYISNFRLVKGTAVYTSGFTPSTTPLTNVSGTSILTLQNSSIVDNSSNALTITNTASVATSVQTPFIRNAFRDKGPQGNHWTPNNIGQLYGTTYDSMTDVPTLTSATAANYAVINPLIKASNTEHSNANLTLKRVTSDGDTASVSTIAMSSGKWYWEVKLHTLNTTGNTVVGIAKANLQTTATYAGANIVSFGHSTTNAAYRYGTFVSNLSSNMAAGDVLGLALDMDSGTLAYYKNNTLIYTTTGVDTTVPHYAYWNSYSVNESSSFNFGQQPFAYTPPSGFVALNTYNL